MDFKKICAYTEALSKNNNRTWFHDNHKEYEEAKETKMKTITMTKKMSLKKKKY